MFKKRKNSLDQIQAFFLSMLFNSHPSENLGMLTAGTFHPEVSSEKHIDRGLLYGQGAGLGGGDIQFDGKAYNREDLLFLYHASLELLHLHGQLQSPSSILSFLDQSDHLLTGLSTSNLASFPSRSSTASHSELLRR